ncbi:hypothetical protein [Moraxella marmotae]|uniref:hypothetical protein n=1 Tax=Moraxella marmotae TaxID=3344520 RepID=UPI0035F2C030
MKFNVLPLIIAFLLSGCTASYYDYPYAYKMYHLKGHFFSTTKQYEKVKEEMLKCGFVNTNNNTYTMSHDEKVQANLCMEKKGYVSETLPKGVCYRYPDSSPCQTHQNKNQK